nr:uncharacterized protein LOC125184486 [Anser cygnoides]
MRSKQAQGREQGRRAATLSHGPARALRQEIRQQRQHPWVLAGCGHGGIVTTFAVMHPRGRDARPGMLQPWDLPLFLSPFSPPLPPLGCPHTAQGGHEGPAGCSPTSARAPGGPEPSTHSRGRCESKRCKERRPAASPTTHSQGKGRVANCKSEMFQQKYFLPTKIALFFFFSLLPSVVIFFWFQQANWKPKALPPTLGTAAARLPRACLGSLGAGSLAAPKPQPQQLLVMLHGAGETSPPQLPQPKSTNKLLEHVGKLQPPPPLLPGAVFLHSNPTVRRARSVLGFCKRLGLGTGLAAAHDTITSGDSLCKWCKTTGGWSRAGGFSPTSQRHECKGPISPQP